MYRHNLMRVNYTTYDVQRSQDNINASTPRHDVMVLANPDDDTSACSRPFRYARVLGVYHVNAIYVGPGMVDYQPHRMEFLWVRWYRTVDALATGRKGRMLDRLQFLPMTDDETFGFLDPSDVLRGCHIIPVFSKGKLHSDGKGLSRCAQDSTDWVEYYVNR
jgi:hypothetical protein